MYAKLHTEIKGWHEKIRFSQIENYIATFTQNQITYIISEYKPEVPTLLELLQKDGVPKTKQLAIMRAVAKAMNHLLNQKEPMSHGHLHPGNILVLLS